VRRGIVIEDYDEVMSTPQEDTENEKPEAPEDVVKAEKKEISAAKEPPSSPEKGEVKEMPDGAKK
jgi:hypothetical protein